MRPGKVWLALAALAALVGCGGETVDPAYRQQIDQWHAERLERLRAPDGWLTLVGLHPLPPGASTVGSDRGRDIRLNAYVEPDLGVIRVADDGISYVPVVSAKVQIDGEEATEARPVPLRSDAGGDPTVVSTGTVSFYVIERGGRPFLRVKDSASERRREFEGIERFPVRERWRVAARLETVNVPPTVPITDILGNVTQEPSPGVLVFQLEGRPHRLIPMAEPGAPLFVVFGDATNGESTYGGGRFLSLDPPAPDGTVIIDFNRAINPPCAFTPYSTCPMPPRENVLPLAVTAGEKAVRDHG
jgi:uncharacterized protein (DUF1684 family)